MRRAAVGLLTLISVGACGARTELRPDSAQSGGARNVSGSPGAGGLASLGGSTGQGGASGGTTSRGGAPPRVEFHCDVAPNDPRVAGIRPHDVATLDADWFVTGPVRTYRWTLVNEDCDAIVPNTEYVLDGVESRVVQFRPSRPSNYSFKLEVTSIDGQNASCMVTVPVQGTGLRVELCWDTSTSTDLDLYVHNPFDFAPWFDVSQGFVPENTISPRTCTPSNCSATDRPYLRPDWGYPEASLDACRSPPFEGFLGKGFCPNPRASDDNNQDIAIGTAERVQLDNPGEGQVFRVMVQNFNNLPAKPNVFVYCGRERVDALVPPPSPRNFICADTEKCLENFRLMWRATDITTHVAPSGEISCTTAPAKPQSRVITINDPTY